MTGHRLLIAAGGPGGPLGRYVTDPGGTTARLARLLLHALAAWGPAAGPVLAVAAAAVIAGRAWLRRRRHQVFADGARQVVILAPPQADPAGAEALWGHLTGLLRPAWARWWHGQPHLGWEYSWTGGAGGGLQISMWVPGIIPPGLVERAVEAAWPGAHAVTTCPAGPALPAGVLATGGTLRLARAEILPLRTGLPADPLRALAGAAAALGDGEHAVLQVLARPVTGARLRRARRAARRLRGGQAPRLASRLLDLATPGRDRHLAARCPGRRPGTGRGHPRRDRQDGRPAVGRADPLRHRHHRRTRPRPGGGSGCGHARPGRRPWPGCAAWPTAWPRRPPCTPGRTGWPAAACPAPPARSTPACSAAAACCRSPSWPPWPPCPLTRPCPAWPGPGHGRCRRRPASSLPGPHARPLGVTDAGAPRPVALAVADGRHHLRIIGATGAGKSTLLTGQVLADAAAGRGAVLIDPKGDAVADILARLPEDAAGRVVLFDPDDRGAPPCLNVLQGDGTGADTDVITDNLTGIFRRIYAAFWGPRTDDLFRSICLTLLGSVPPGSGQVTLADIPALLTDEARRRRITATIRDPVLRGFWSWWEELSPASQAAVAGPLMNKLRAFLLRKFARQAIAAGPSTFDMSAVLDKRRAAAGPAAQRHPGRGDRAAGRVVPGRPDLAGRRPPRPAPPARPARRRPVRGRVPELPEPALPAAGHARRGPRLPAGRRHGPPGPRPAPRRTCARASARTPAPRSSSPSVPEDARQLERHTLPQLTAHDLSHLGAWQAAARLVAGSAEQAAFTLRTEPLPPAVPGRARMIRRAARAAYSTGTAAAPPARRHDPRSR